ncbi:MAG: hypothetical protein KDC93_03870 [Cyclobacteriaceae bacterium]|jgi:hypothetical protein|nr:hypothetical protein [Cyclobacteriaceae bacterium]
MISILYSFLLLFHPLHISVTEIEYNEKVEALQIISRIFVDDLEVAIRAKTELPDLDILNPKKGLTTKGLIADYVKDHLKIRLDGKEQQLNFLGYEEENLAFICYIEIEKVKTFKVIEVENTVITEAYDDQSNLVHVTYKGPIKSMRLMKDKPSDKFTF